MRIRDRWRRLVLMMAAAAPTAALGAQEPGRAISCAPGTAGEAGAWLAQARAAVGLPAAADSVLHIAAMTAQALVEQSDRTYPPYILHMQAREQWFLPGVGLQAFGARDARQRTFVAGTHAFRLPSTPAPLPRAAQRSLVNDRGLNPWAVLWDWSQDRTARVAERCMLRDYPRVVLSRSHALGAERLYLDEKTGFPVRLERTEPHFLWGDVLVHIDYATWWRVGQGSYYPVAVTRQMDGVVTHVVTAFPGSARLVPADSGPPVGGSALPEVASALGPSPLDREFGSGQEPDTVRVGPDAFLLVAPAYTQAVVLARDTIFLLDATTGERRARQDSVWIGKLFRGRFPVAVVVTDLAWPHIAGVRFWVASGASIIAHESARPFLERVVNRRWDRAPDRLEASRQHARLQFRPIVDSLALAGGLLRLYAIDGISSETGVMAFFEPSHFLWAGDFIQDSATPMLYTNDVYRAAQRAGIEPATVAAQHLPLTAWSVITGAVLPELRR